MSVWKSIEAYESLISDHPEIDSYDRSQTIAQVGVFFESDYDVVVENLLPSMRISSDIYELGGAVVTLSRSVRDEGVRYRHTMTSVDNPLIPNRSVVTFANRSLLKGKYVDIYDAQGRRYRKKDIALRRLHYCIVESLFESEIPENKLEEILDSREKIQTDLISPDINAQAKKGLEERLKHLVL